MATNLLEMIRTPRHLDPNAKRLARRRAYGEPSALSEAAKRAMLSNTIDEFIQAVGPQITQLNLIFSDTPLPPVKKKRGAPVGNSTG